MASPHRPTLTSGSHPRPKSRQESAEQAQSRQLTAAVDSCIAALPGIRDLLPEPDDHGARTGTIGRHSPESSEPWQGAAAAVYWTIHFGARQLEASLRADVGISPHLPDRGGSEANTISALIQVGRMATASTAGMLKVAVNRVERWVTAIDQLADVDRAEEWKPLPRLPGALITCPFCELLTLRMNLRREVVRCVNPSCQDSEGRSPVARMERGRMSGMAQLVFRDGREVDYRELAENPAPEE